MAGIFISQNSATSAQENIVINEVFYDPAGTDTALEFIEGIGAKVVIVTEKIRGLSSYSIISLTKK